MSFEIMAMYAAALALLTAGSRPLLNWCQLPMVATIRKREECLDTGSGQKRLMLGNLPLGEIPRALNSLHVGRWLCPHSRPK